MKPHVRAVVLAIAGLVCTLVMTGKTMAQAQRPTDESAKHYLWLSDRLQEAESIKPGMTKADLLKVFFPDGGLQHFQPQAFVLRSCNMIKVEVTFDLPEGASPGNLPPASELKIKSISKPYLEYMHAD